jgi:glycosyltransferase involved in cell wall biosynthesis
MKLLYFAGGISISETFIYELVLGLSKKIDVNLVLANEPFYKKDIKYQVENIKVSKRISKKLNYYLETRGKKIVYNWQQKKASRVLNTHIQNADVVYVDYGTNAVKILPALIQNKKPFIVHFHGYDITSELNFSEYKKSLLTLFEHASAIVTASYHIKRMVVLAGGDEEKIHVVRLGVFIDEKNNVTDKEIDFISIGRLTPKKNPLASILAFSKVLKKHTSTNYHIIGEGPLYKECKALVAKLGIQNNVVFQGSLPHNQVLEYLQKARVYIQHSVTAPNGDQEGFAISLAEAALFKIPVVSTLHNGIPENVIDGETGFLVREFDYESMADKMCYLYENPDFATKMGEKGREHILNLCNKDRRVEQLESIIKVQVIGK